MRPQDLFTVGYEGTDLKTFLTALRVSGVTQVIDIRELPLSRKPGFSKSAIAEALGDVGIRYLHLRDLGDPKTGREAAKRGDHNAFLRIYHRHLQTDAAQAALAVATEIATKTPSCLLCFERDPVGCHRSIVATAIADMTDIRVVHLSPSKPSLQEAAHRHGSVNAATVW